MKIPILAYIAMASSLLPVAIGLYRWKLLSKPLRYFAIFSCTTSLQVALEYILGRLKIHTNILSDIYRAIEISFLILFFAYFLETAPKKRFFYFLLGFFFLAWIITTSIDYDSSRLNSIMALMARFVLIISAIIMMHDLVVKTSQRSSKIYHDALFWIITGVLLYCSGTIIVLGLGNEIIKYGIDYFFLIWYINWSFFIISNIFYSRSFFVQVK